MKRAFAFVLLTSAFVGCHVFSGDDSRSPPAAPDASVNETSDAEVSEDAEVSSDAEAGSIGESTPCEAGTWNHSGDATSCVAWTTCNAGTFVTNTPSPTSDRTCEACAAGTYSTSTNVANCTPWTVCGSDDVERMPGSSTSDRACLGIAWTRQFGSTGNDSASSVSVDGSGNVYVVGDVWGALPGQMGVGMYDAYVKKFDGIGKELWTRQFGSTEYDTANSVSVDKGGNVYVVGYAGGTLSGQTSSGNRDAYVRKYDGAGQELWTRQFGGKLNDFARSVIVDGDGNVYVAGETEGALSGQSGAGGLEGFVRKFDSLGGVLWTRQFGSDKDDSASSMALDRTGNVYVAGYTDGTLSGQTSAGLRDAYVRKYDGAGQELWTRQFGSNKPDSEGFVNTDGSGNVYVVGDTWGALPGQTNIGQASDAYVRKYDSAGKHVWSRQFGVTNGKTSARSLSVDGGGSIYVTGDVEGTFLDQMGAGGRDGFLRKYDDTGNELWTRQFGSNDYDFVPSVSMDGNGSMYLAGSTRGAFSNQKNQGNSDAFVLRMNP